MMGRPCSERVNLIEKKVQEIQVTLAVTYSEARNTAEGLDKRTYANVSKISQQQSQPSNN